MTFARRNPRIGAIVRVNISIDASPIFVLLVARLLDERCVFVC